MKKRGNILICVPNWLGDSIMCMPGVDAFKQVNPDCRVSILVKSGLAGLWEMCPFVDKVQSFDKSAAGTLAAGFWMRKENFDAAYVFPNSFRSAFIPFFAGIPRRVGSAGHHRAWMLTDVIAQDRLNSEAHQSGEYFVILGLEPGDPKDKPVPDLCVPDCAKKTVAELIPDNGTEVVGFIPGAAFGPAKQWPPECWIELGRQLATKTRARIMVFGLENERELCGRVSSALDNALDLSGKTSLAELTALLGRCRVAVCNDSGGMHLAAAVGTQVVAVFGMTDPVKTAPVGPGHTVLAARDVDHKRDIGRDCPDAIAAMRSITPKEVLRAVEAYLPGRN
ncbi:MAG: lipopolysaccharide heptosyltransferase II [Verrucomicrobiota bacterium]